MLRRLKAVIRRWWRWPAAIALSAVTLAVSYLAAQFLVLWPVTQAADLQSPAISQPELEAHVRFLAQPALKGRLPWSQGSQIARRYIVERFTASKLKPWADAPKFEQPFNLGTNIVGLLPGSDPALADEIILVTAHYDHLGFGHLGACDDASGVAALLETAEALANANPPPKRTVAFAAFDCEEAGLIGAYAFSLRPDVQCARIRAVINMDMLGRSFLDLVDNAVIVAGTEFYPQTRAAVLAEGDAQGIRVYPAGLDLAGARGDHVAFLNLPRTGAAEALGPPEVLFFTNGTFDDYHEKGDRAERIDYLLLTRSTRVIEESTRRFANADTLESRTPCAVPDPAELDIFRAVGTEVLRQRTKLALTEEQRAAAQSWLRQAEACTANSAYCSDDREDLIRKLDTLGPGVDRLIAKALGGGSDHLKDGDLRQIAGAGEMWRRYGAVFDEGYRGFVERLLKQNVVSLALHGMPGGYYSFELPCISDEDITIDSLDDGRLRLSMVAPRPGVWVGLSSFGRAGFALNVDGDLFEVKGTRDELIDWCLLYWMDSRPIEEDVQAWLDRLPATEDREEQKRWMESEREPRKVRSIDAGCLRLLEKVSGEKQETTLDACIERRLREKGLASRDAWLVSLLDSENPRLAGPAAGRLGRLKANPHAEAIRTTYLRFLNDTQAPTERRAGALHWLSTSGSKESLRCVVAYLDDPTVVVPLPAPADDESSPIHRHPIVRYGERMEIVEPEAEDTSLSESKSAVTLGEVALYELKESIGQDFGTDSKAWLQWLEGESTELKDTCGCHRKHPALREHRYYSWYSAQ